MVNAHAKLDAERKETFFLQQIILLKPKLLVEKNKKTNLPSKICVICNRPFTWRKKWERSWDEIRFCSKKV